MEISHHQNKINSTLPHHLVELVYNNKFTAPPLNLTKAPILGMAYPNMVLQEMASQWLRAVSC